MDVQPVLMMCVLILLFLFTCILQDANGARLRKRKLTAEEQLMMDLFKGYDTDARAVINSSATVTVSIDFLLLRLQSLNERSQVLMTTGLVITEWSDERLTWDPKLYSNISDVVVRAGRIWTPELAIINGANNMIQEFEKIRVLISYNGKVHWEPGGVFSTTCDIDITYFPFDSQSCPIEIGAWSYKSSRMNLTNVNTKMETGEFRRNGEWDIIGTTAKWTAVVLPCCPDMKYSKVEFLVHMNRRYMFYIMNIILPCLLLSCLILIVFCVPPDAGEKISSGISVLLAFTVFLLMLADNVPRTSLDVPILVIYLGTTMALGTASVGLSVVVLHFHHRGRHGPVPKWARTFLLGKCARVLGVPGALPSVAEVTRSTHAHPANFRLDECDSCEMLEMQQHILDSKGRPISPDDIVYHHRHDNHVNTHYQHMQQQQQQQQQQDQHQPQRQQQEEIEVSPPSSPRATHEEVTAQQALEENIKEWQLLARVLDRIFFIIVFTIMLMAAVFILLSPWYTNW